jgi:deoxyribodipyrimidine photo-lyase
MGTIMPKKNYKKSLFIFRRDLRLEDNTALIACNTLSETIVPIFIYDPRQITAKNNYASANAIQCMRESLEDLNTQLNTHNARLYELYGEAHLVIEDLIKKNGIDAVFFNKDYTPFSRTRDARIEKICKKYTRAHHAYDDALLNSPSTVMTKKGTPYTIFTPYARTSSTIHIQTPQQLRQPHFFTGTLTSVYTKKLSLPHIHNQNIAVPGGTHAAKSILKKISKYAHYERDRNIPAHEATTKLSAHNKFGTISIRTVYQHIQKTLGSHHPLIAQLYWRDFFTQLAYHYPHVFGAPFRTKYHTISWKNNRTWFNAWCTGTTGFPIVDAGMRELNTTGFMHNRVRMITASFLIKDLHIDWRWGEKYFAQQLVDYDPAVNNGNWQWVASTGADAQPYFRIFNPWLQQKKYDTDCTYIKKWIPELRELTPRDIHAWYKTHNIATTTYPKPIIDHAKQVAITKKIYNV